jgi:hypothetical protein
MTAPRHPDNNSNRVLLWFISNLRSKRSSLKGTDLWARIAHNTYFTAFVFCAEKPKSLSALPWSTISPIFTARSMSRSPSRTRPASARSRASRSSRHNARVHHSHPTGTLMEGHALGSFLVSRALL